MLSGQTAIDPETGAELYASHGRRMNGRGTRYTCRVQTSESVLRKAFTVTARSDCLAIEQANKALARFLSKSPVWSDEQGNWVFAAKEARP